MSRNHVKATEEPSEIKQELLALTGSTEGYNSLMQSIERQMAKAAQTRGRLDVRTGKLVAPKNSRP